MFFCTWCYKKVLFAVKIESEAQSRQEEFETNFKLINAKLHSNIAEAAKNFEVQLGEHHKSFADTLNNHPTQLSANPVPATIPEEFVAHIAVSLAVEQKEKEKRRLNIIVHNQKLQIVILGKIMIFQNVWIYLRLTLEFQLLLKRLSAQARSHPSPIY